MHAVQSADKLEHFKSACYGFVDTLTWAKSLLPATAAHNLSALYAGEFSISFAAHNALADVKALQAVLKAIDATSAAALMPFSSTCSSTIILADFLLKRAEHLVGLKVLIKKKIVSAAMATIAGSGLLYTHLHDAFCRRGADGLRAVLTEKPFVIVVLMDSELC